MKRSVHRLVAGLVLGVFVLSVSVLSLSTASSAQVAVGVSVRVGPPALPVYAQPICPGPGYLWTPGYWAWSDDDGYYWVPGTWVVAPVGMLWTPGYWAFSDGFYGWHAGYWGPHVGFYGGINYGFGYGGVGFGGGEWRGGAFFYNRSVTNVNVTNVTNVYSRTVIVNNTRNVSYNGPGGIDRRPTRQEEAFAHEPHRAVLAAQSQHERAASRNRELFAAENHGRPAIAATAKPGEFRGPHLERARAAGEPYRAPKLSPREARGQSPDNRGAGNRVTNNRVTDNRGGNRGTDNRGNRGFEASARNGGNGNSNDRVARLGNREAGNNREQRSSRDNLSRDNMRRDNPSRDNTSRDNPRYNARPDRQEKAAPQRMERQNRAQGKAEPKRDSREQHR